jgi:PAS domain S-box-containing protein/putative nucleotidyltransferase with HDIG domain
MDQPADTRAHRRHCAEILDSLDLALLLYDISSDTITDANAFAAELFGCARQDMIGLSGEAAAARLLAGTGRRAAERIQKAAAGEAQVFQWHARHGTGRRFRVEVRLRHIDIEGRAYLLAAVRDIAQPAATLRALRKSERLYRRIFENTQDIIACVNVRPDNSFTFGDINPAAEQLYGIPAAMVRGKRPEELFSPEIADRHYERLRHCLEAGIPLRFDESINFHTEEMIVDTVYVPLKTDSGRIRVIVIFAHNITERSRTVAALQANEDKLKMIMDDVPVAMHWTDLEGHIEYVNNMFRQLFGYSLKEIPTLEAWFSRAYPDPAYRRQVSKERRELVARKQAGDKRGWPRELRIVTRDGSVRYVQAAITMTADRLLTIYDDITERKRAELALQKSERFYRMILDNTQDSVGIIKILPGRRSRLLYANPKNVQRIGLKREQLIGKGPEDIFSAEVAAHINRDLWQCVDEGKIKHHEEYLLLPGGEAMLETTYIPIGDETGAVGMVIAVSHDISERKRAEKDLKESFDRLGKTIDSIIDAIAVIVEARDPYTAGHLQRVARLAAAIAGEMGLPADAVEGVRVAGLLHDVGKISVPSEILNKPGKLGPTEMNIVKTYPQSSYEILRRVNFPWPVARIALQHQERYNGSGYPEGLKNEAILPEARILAVADVVEAMAAYRPYHFGAGIEDVLKDIAEKKGILYDPAVVDACIRLFKDRHFEYDARQTDENLAATT